MISEEEKSQIADLVIEKFLVRLTDIIGYLFVEKVNEHKMLTDFYEKNKSFKEFPNIVGPSIQKVQEENPGKSYEWYLEQATPLISERIGIAQKLDTNTVLSTKPKDIKFKESSMGIL